MSLKLLNTLKKEVLEQYWGLAWQHTLTDDSKKKAEYIHSNKRDFSIFGSLNVDLFDKNNIYKASDKRGTTYGWRNPIWKLCCAVKTDSCGPRYCDYHWHHGRDYAMSTGHHIVSLVSGVVEGANAYGDWVLTIKYSNGAKGRYIHCNEFFVNKGDEIKAGQTIAAVGNKGHSAGSHLHYEYYPENGTTTTQTHESIKGSGTITANIKDTDPATVDDKLFLFVKIGKEKDFEQNLLNILNGKINNQNTNTLETDKRPLYNSLPDDIKKAIDKLKTDWGVEITEKHLDKEFKQEKTYREDNGGVNPVAKEAIDLLLSDLKKEFSYVPATIVSSYRSYDDQVINFGKKVKNDKRTIDDVQSYNTVPGFSQHHTGLSFDIISTDEDWWNKNKKVKEWVANNCGFYGFEVTYKTDGVVRKAEPWHLYYSGPLTYEEETEYDEEEDENNLTETDNIVFIAGLDNRNGDLTLEEQKTLLQKNLKTPMNIDAFRYFDINSTLTAIEKKPKSKVVAFSAGCKYSEDIARKLISVGGNLNNFYIMEPFNKDNRGATKTSVQNAVDLGVPSTNVYADNYAEAGQGIVKNHSYTPKCSPLHWCALSEISKIL